MTDDTSHISDLDMKPTYQASIALRFGGTARVTVCGKDILFDVRDDDGRLIPAQLADNEAMEIASMMHAADRATSRGH
jgi:hypothetical protein